jgi:hypothetical protein
MLRRLLLTLSLLAALSMPAHAALRAPQVPVSGTALATFFASQGQTIDVNHQQVDLQTLNLSSSTTFETHAFGPDASAMFGGYNTGTAVPPLYQVFPGAASTGWFSLASFRSSPTRLVVSIFDENSVIVGSTTYLSGPPDATAFGFYVQQAGGGSTFYTQDSRDPGGAARILAYNGTGTRTGWTWFACETGAGPGGDYADYIALVNLSQSPVPVMQTNWGTLKSRFR